MKHTEQEILEIAKNIQKQLEKNYNKQLIDKISYAKYISKTKEWEVTGVYELFGEEEYMWYFICDETGKLLGTANKFRSNPHLPDTEISDKEFLKEWEDYERENPEDFV